MIIPLCVPIWDEKLALSEGVQYDKTIGFYIDSSKEYVEHFLAWTPAKFNPNLQGKALLPDMLPVTSWEKNLRTILPAEKWDRIRKHVYAAAGYRCEVCAEKGFLEAHEKWTLINETQVQKLEKIMAVCPVCHKAHHIGNARSSGMLPAVKAKLMDVNGWSLSEVDYHLEEAFEVWKQRCEWEWTLDIEIVYTNGYLYV